MSRTFTARFVFPVSGPPHEGGTVTIRGDRIEAVKPRGVRSPDEDLGNAAIIPGLVNAHTHLDLSGALGLIPPTDPDHFTDWLRGVIAYRRTRTPEQTQADTRAGLAECLHSGTTLIGDIAAEGASWDALGNAPTRAVVFHELIGLSEERSRSVWAQLVATWQHVAESETCRKGLSPHAPYSANRHTFSFAATTRAPISTHLAESPGELALLNSQTGPFVEFLRSLSVWAEHAVPNGATEVFGRCRHTPHALYVHGNYLNLADLDGFRRDHAIVYCPRTHAAFGHPPHPFREFLARGVRVCLGTDSLASNPDLDILAEARFVRGRYPDFPGEQLLRMVTLAGAEALGWADECGSLEAGKSADLVAVPLPDADATDPHELLLADHPGERRTMFRGEFRSEPGA